MSNPYQSVLDAQRARFDSDVTKTLAWRIAQLDRMERMLHDHQDALCAALYEDFGKPPFEQLFEISVPTGVIRYYREHLHELMAPQTVAIPPALEAAGNAGMIYKEPYGVTLVIGPFNAPILLLLDPAIAALAAGNTVVLKPANTTPATAALLSRLVPQYFSPEDVAVVTGGRQEIGALLELPFDFIFFTGSSAVGKVVMRAAAEHLTPVLLELGGQNPCIVDETANLDIAADRVAWGHNAISGQWCIAPGYVYVHESVAEAFIAKLKASITAMYGDDPQQSPDFARMISEHDAERVASYIVADKVVHGGRHDIAARYVEPTVLYPSTWDDPAMQQEVFGPVLPVLPYRDLREIVGIMKRKPKPLACYVFSKRQASIDCVLNSLSFGGGCVNQTNLHCWIDSLPFGGVGNSGMGKYYGKAGFDALSNTKAMLIGNPDAMLDVFPPYAGKDIGKMLGVFA
ncbi:putative coniferyl aldehyde dehydrogenase [Burkholderia cenocepacia]|uniref:aldehyde dehydrogenase family protein n=1 Tax=Burkholderia cenocepacia TaxID=95486 RepID=UPI0008470C2E|nr:aldehyde dehydrogenase family protein [Burkholderia cenocepacia]RQT97019.1 aldehyde dehydrogenase family protein [Burkholderia cenocepacia]RQU53434.1 aldehyde dehydrogenase family protein [Burkholderia cenocepacia]CAB5154848.1 putative coniferyl aldehyde dehydrogenase [Burkholderia cenocepacia]CAB5157726.1 putative coniferyl aldehyde dehydrogenase [Burkholderia cenocepacia]CAB5165872.1 putative coniferyl aldehyde dehydrogenase [Burkholderia cenocepacia]